MATPGTNLLFYDPTAGVGEFYQVAKGQMRQIGHQDGWRPSWMVIRLISNPSATERNLAGLLFYGRSDGTLQLYRLHNNNAPWIESTLLLEGWRPGWTDIVVNGDNSFLCYDRGAGVGELYRIDPGGGSITLIGRHTGWRTDWDIITSYQFEGAPSYLFFYESASGTGEIYTVRSGQISLISSHTGLPTTWTQIVFGYFGAKSRIGLLGYSALLGEGDFYDVTGGSMSRIAADTGWRTTWSAIVPSYYGGRGPTGLLFYDAVAATGEIYDVENGSLSLLSKYEGWRSTWAKILVSGYVPVG